MTEELIRKLADFGWVVTVAANEKGEGYFAKIITRSNPFVGMETAQPHPTIEAALQHVFDASNYEVNHAYKLVGTETGRLACAEPNLSNLSETE